MYIRLPLLLTSLLGGLLAFSATAQDKAELRSDTDDFTIQWEKRIIPRAYGEADIFGLAHAPEGGFYIAGSIEVSGRRTDAFIKRLNADGMVIWEKTMGGPDEYDGFNALAAMPDGGVVAAGINESRSKAGEGYGWAVRFDADGAVVWDKTFHRPQNDLLYRFASKGGFLVHMVKGWDVFYTAAPALSGGVYLAGETSQNDDDGDGWMLHLDADGKILHEYQAGAGDWDDFMAILPTPQGDVYLAGTHQNDDSQKGRIVCLGPDGQERWVQDIAAEQSDLSFFALGMLENGNVAVIGDDEAGYPSKGRFIQIDDAGTIIAQSVLGTNDDKLYFAAIDVASSDIIYVTGHAEVYADDFGHGVILTLTPQGTLRSQTHFQGMGDTYFDAVLMANNGDIIIAGTTDTEDGNQTQAVLMRLTPSAP